MRSPIAKLDMIRRSRGLTYEDVHAQLEARGHSYSVSTIGHWFNGTRRPRKLGDLIALCEALETSLAEVLGEDISYARSQREQLLLGFFRNMTAEQQAAYLLMAETVAKRDSKKQ